MEYAIGTLGLRLAITSINGITDAARNINYVGASLYNNVDANKEIIQFLNKIDITNTVQILNNLIKELNINEKTPNTIVACLESIHDTIKDIEMEIKDIQNRLEYNRSLYFCKGLRSYKFNNSIRRMDILNTRLEIRMNILFKIIQLKESLTKKEIDCVLKDSWIHAEKNIIV